MPFDEVGRALVLKAPSGSSWATWRVWHRG